MPVKAIRPGLARAEPGAAASPRLLILVGGSAALAASLEEPGRELLAAGVGASHAGVRCIDGAAGDAATYASLPEAAELSVVVALDGPADAAAATEVAALG